MGRLVDLNPSDDRGEELDTDELRAVLDEFGLSQKACARFFDVTDRTVRRWATGEQEVPLSVVMTFTLMRRFGLTPDDVEALLTE